VAERKGKDRIAADRKGQDRIVADPADTVGVAVVADPVGKAVVVDMDEADRMEQDRVAARDSAADRIE